MYTALEPSPMGVVAGECRGAGTVAAVAVWYATLFHAAIRRTLV